VRTNINRVVWRNAQTLDWTVTSRLIYVQKVTYALMSHGENAWKYRNIKTGNKIFKISGLLDNDHNKFVSHSQIKSILNWKMLVSHHSVQNLLPSNCNCTSWLIRMRNLVSCPKELHLIKICWRVYLDLRNRDQQQPGQNLCCSLIIVISTITIRCIIQNGDGISLWNTHNQHLIHSILKLSPAIKWTFYILNTLILDKD